MAESGNSKRLTVVIPSRSQPLQARFLTRCIASIRAQTARPQVAIEVLVCLDQGERAPVLPDPKGTRFVEAAGRGQAAALNAGAAQADGDFLAFLEDDDHWHPERLAFGLRALESGDFTSSTQLEFDPAGAVIRINDFPTPSGWLMKLSSWTRIGPFDESYRWHLDSDWLGRLGESGLQRIHLVESTAPVDPDVHAEIRPWLSNCIRFGGPNVMLGRHPFPVPLVNRLIHPQSGMGTIALHAHAKEESDRETERLISRFGRLPW
jgi:glycosyltransferase involved in cell wall biosynthesis